MNNPRTSPPLWLSSRRSPPLWRDGGAAVVVLLGALLQVMTATTVLESTGGRGGLPLDDSYIHTHFARNLRRGLGFVYNPGVPVAGSTAPGWTILLAAAAPDEDRLPETAFWLSAIFYVAAGLATYRLARWLRLAWPLALFAGAVVLLNGRMIWNGASGMETCAFAWFALVGLQSHIRDRLRGTPGPATAFLIGVGSLFRPEGYLLFALMAVDHLLAFDPRSRQFHVTARPWLSRRAVAAAAVFWIAIGPYMAFCYWTNGHPFPNTYYAKQHESFTTTPAVFLDLLGQTILDSPSNAFAVTVLLAGIGALAHMAISYRGEGGPEAARLRAARLFWLWPLAYVLYSAVLRPHLMVHSGRYAVPLIPVMILLSALGAGAAAELIRSAMSRMLAAPAAVRSGQIVMALALAAAAFPAASRAPEWRRVTARCVKDINDQHIRVGQWLREHTPPDAVIATHDVGAIPYFSERRVIDLYGLVDTSVMRFIAAEKDSPILLILPLAHYLYENRPEYLAVYPGWYDIYAVEPDAFETVFEADLGRAPTIAGNASIRVYRVDWDRIDPEKIENLWEVLSSRTYGYGYSGYYGAETPPAAPGLNDEATSGTNSNYRF